MKKLRGRCRGACLKGRSVHRADPCSPAQNAAGLLHATHYPEQKSLCGRCSAWGNNWRGQGAAQTPRKERGATDLRSIACTSRAPGWATSPQFKLR